MCYRKDIRRPLMVLLSRRLVTRPMHEGMARHSSLPALLPMLTLAYVCLQRQDKGESKSDRVYTFFRY